MDLHDYDRLEVDDTSEMLALLRESASRRALCSVRASGRPESYLSPLREVADDGSAMLDAPRVPVIERALGPGSVASIDVRFQTVRVRFDARVHGIDGTARHGAQLRLARPSSLVKLHRRESVRVRVPDALQVLLTLDGSEPALASVPMQDLFVQGGSLSVSGVRDRLEAGRLFESARLMLPDGEERTVTVRIAHAAVLRRGIDGSDVRLGVQFVNPKAEFESAVARAVREIARAPAGVRRA
jgi:hypothetical protein